MKINRLPEKCVSLSTLANCNKDNHMYTLMSDNIYYYENIPRDTYITNFMLCTNSLYINFL